MSYTQSLNPIKRTSFKFLPLEVTIKIRDKIITPNYEISILTLFSPKVQIPAV